ncbi:MAG: UvrABC system protein A [Pirellulaceae bacterium]|nr:MAG: UvrABC system protein A [Pirellulaceae bacterium]
MTTTRVVDRLAPTSSAGSIAPERIDVRGARTHNLQNIDVQLPHGSFVVVTGVSGSGKSSLAIDTIFAEGQRQYIESLSTYARQFLDQLARPEVDVITGLEPTLCIDQRSGMTSPRSTVATITEIYDYLRLFMARLGTVYCYRCGAPIAHQTREQIAHELASLPEGTRLVLLSPVVRGRRGTHRDVLERLQQAGLVRARIDGQLVELDAVPPLDVRKEHSIDAVVDKLIVRAGNRERLWQSLDVALDLSDGLVTVSYLLPNSASENGQQWCERLFSTQYACAQCGVSYVEVEPRTFSFNSPHGACPVCQGTGLQRRIDPQRLVDWRAAPSRGGFSFLECMETRGRRQATKYLQEVVRRAGGRWTKPLDQLPESAQRELQSLLDAAGSVGQLLQQELAEMEQADRESGLEQFTNDLPCQACGGARLRPEALSVRVEDKNIHQICSLSIEEVTAWLRQLSWQPFQQAIAAPILNDVLHRLRFLSEVGLGYLTLNRAARTLSGGELQRVRLASSIGSGLVGVCYILDEPSIGLHAADHERLINCLRELQRLGNTVIVVEHEQAMMEAADLLIDVGPGAGKEGGRIVAAGAPAKVRDHPQSLTAAYLRGEKRVRRSSPLRRPNRQTQLILEGATLHNLQAVKLVIPLGLLVGITGVSGSGKSSLIGQTLIPALASAIGHRPRTAGPYRHLRGTEHLDKIVEVDQQPIGRTPRSTPATYVGVFDLIRQVFASSREAKSRGYTASRFSFNTGQGRCDHCQGQGQEKIEMNFLPDIYVTCPVCRGRRFNRATLQIRYHEKTIADCLEMSVDEAAEFFGNFDKIVRLLAAMQQVGLGYLSLGQPSSTLSGGEAQRIKLATELARRDTGKTIYFFDEPTTGLHFADIQRLIDVFDRLVARGNTVVVIEHNLDVIRNCDWLIDMGPGGGDAGGKIVAQGPPARVRRSKRSVTAQFL